MDPAVDQRTDAGAALALYDPLSTVVNAAGTFLGEWNDPGGSPGAIAVDATHGGQRLATSRMCSTRPRFSCTTSTAGCRFATAVPDVIATHTGASLAIAARAALAGFVAARAWPEAPRSVAADELGVPYDKVRPIIGDTGSVSFNFLTGGSRSAFSGSMAIVEAAIPGIGKSAIAP